jgi:hypothetical protein
MVLFAPLVCETLHTMAYSQKGMERGVFDITATSAD